MVSRAHVRLVALAAEESFGMPDSSPD